MPHTSYRSLIRVVVVCSITLVAVWAFTARSLTPLPSRPLPAETESDADSPRPDHPSEAVLFRKLPLVIKG
jgi:hypothetical protein